MDVARRASFREKQTCFATRPSGTDDLSLAILPSWRGTISESQRPSLRIFSFSNSLQKALTFWKLWRLSLNTPIESSCIHWRHLSESSSRALGLNVGRGAGFWPGTQVFVWILLKLAATFDCMVLWRNRQ